MKINGEEFLKNVSLEQDKATLQDRQTILESQKKRSVGQEATYFENDINLNNDSTLKIDDREAVINKLEDIALKPDIEGTEKKKWIILAIVVVIISLAIVVVMRLLSNNAQEQKLKDIEPKQEKLQKEKILDSIKPDIQAIKHKKQVKKVIEEKLDIQTPPIVEEPVKEQKVNIDLPEPKKEKPVVKIDKQKKQKEVKDLFGLEKTAKPVEKQKKKQQKKEIKKTKSVKIYSQPKRQIVVPAPTEVNVDKKVNGKLRGYFVQIGAFTKQPTKKFLSNILAKGYNYKIYSITIKGKKFNKVLIGPYPTKQIALKNRAKIRKAFKNPGAYILKF
jgi:DedD protein